MTSTSEPAKDSRFLVKKTPDGLVAYLALANEVERTPETVEAALACLKQEGIRFGLDEEAVRNLIDVAVPGTYVPVAKGVAPRDGTAARIEYAFDPQAVQGRPRELPDGSVDFYDLGKVRNVLAGQVLARKTPATAGEPGTSVTGDPLPARPGRDHPLPTGRNVTTDDAGLTVSSQIDGHLVYVDGRINVFEVLEINENVDLSTGNIKFVGSVIVRGSVLGGLSVEADGNVDVHGFVDGATIRAAGHITVRSGLRGGGKGVLEATGDVAARFAENATILAGGEVRLIDSLIQCSVRAGTRIVVNGGRGVIIGGRLRAGEEIVARVIGTELSIPTELEVGMDPRRRERFLEVQGALSDLRKNIQRVTLALRHLKNVEAKGQLPREQQELMVKLAMNYRHLAETSANLEREREELEEEMVNSRRGRIRAFDMIYPGTRVSLNQSFSLISDPIPGGSLVVGETGDIAIGPV